MPRCKPRLSYMEKDSGSFNEGFKTGEQQRRPCAGGLRPARKKSFDPTSWYVVIVKQRNELVSRKILDGYTDLGYSLETYVAAQKSLSFSARHPRKIVERVVIPSKLFVRVDEAHRQDVLKLCSFLSGYMMDPSLSLTETGFRAFARVPDQEIRQLRQILDLAEGPVEYFDTVPRPGDKIQVLTGQFHGLKGEVFEVSGKHYVTVTLNSLGTFRFRLPLSAIGQLVSHPK